MTITGRQVILVENAFKRSRDYSQFYNILKNDIDRNIIYNIWIDKKTTIKIDIEFNTIESIYNIV